MRKRSRPTQWHAFKFTRKHAIMLILACIILSFILARTEHPRRRHFVSPLAVETR